MKKLITLLGLVVALQGCALTSTPEAAQTRVDLVQDISDLNQIKSLVPNDLEKVLYVFDIDDTLLTAHHEFGSDYWFGWNAESGALPFNCVLDATAILTEEKSLTPTQADAPAIFNAIKHDKMMLTSRNASTARGASVRELTANGYKLPASLNGDSTGALFRLEKNRPAGYFDGIYMVTGQNKGTGLIYLLNQVLDIKGKYQSVVLVDDGRKNIDRMRAALKDAGINYYGLHYVHIDKPEQVSEQLQTEWKGSWKQFMQGLASASKARHDAFVASGCEYN